jgi:hypothetical protein
MGFLSQSSTESNVQIPLQAGSISNLQVSVITAPGSGNSWTITVRKAGADTAVTCTISGSATTCSDTSHSVSFTEGQLVSIETTPASTPTGTSLMTYSVLFS